MPGYPCCCTRVCPECNGAPPEQLQVDFSGVADADCGECDTYWANSFILDRDPGNACRWTYVEDPFACAAVECDPDEWHMMDIAAQYIKQGSNYKLRVTVTECQCTSVTTDTCMGVAIFEKDYGEMPPDCLPAESQTLTRTLGLSNLCDWSAASCTVQAV